MGFEWKGIGGIALRTKDFEAMDRFYTSIIEAERISLECNNEGKPVHAVYRVGRIPQTIELYDRDSEYNGGSDQSYTGENLQPDRSHYHCCLEIDARHEAYRDMQKKGVKVFGTRDDSVGMCGSWCSFIKDPEGNEWEFMEFSPVSRQIAAYENNMRFKG